MTDAHRIRMLDDHVVNKIAAGEVVDRPASVVKELMENAVDAGATQIEVEIVAGGREAIVITDDGSGMGRDDALLSLERHATSKIRNEQDIERVATLGFRGEALAAISAVSRFTLRTCRRGDSSGTEVSVTGGKVAEVQETAPVPGTQIAVRNLFFNMPARRKFLRSDATELTHIRQVFLLYALAYPDLGLRLVVDRREMHRLPPGASLEERLRDLYPPQIVEALRPIRVETPEVRVHGYIGLPSTARGDRSDQYYFINRRPATAPVIHFALGEGCREALPRDKHPAVFLFLELPPETVDVNVHPTKREVRFRHPGAVRDAILRGVRVALGFPASPEDSIPMGGAPVPALPSIRPAPGLLPMPAGPDPLAPAPLTPSGSGIPEFRADVRTPPAPPVAGNEAATTMPAGPRINAGGPWKWFRILGQAGGHYVVLETEDGLVLMDPQAAHERVLYERFMREVRAQGVKGQGLLLPQTLALPPKDAHVVRRHLELLRANGFGVNEFGGDTFMIDAVPAVFGELSAGAFLAELAQVLEQGGGRPAADFERDVVARTAARHSVRAHSELKPGEMERLVCDLAACEMPYTCPRGRPTLLHFGYGELARKFGRA